MFFSYGVCLWEMLVRGASNPLSGQGALKYHNMVKEQKMPCIPDWSPASFTALIQRCWAFEPDQRPSFEEIVTILKDMIEKGDKESFAAIHVSCNFKG